MNLEVCLPGLESRLSLTSNVTLTNLRDLKVSYLSPA